MDAKHAESWALKPKITY